MKALIGIVIVVLHGLGFVWLEQRSRGDELAVDISQLHLDSSRGPGLVRKHWTKTYRGGFTRDVGVTQLVGPFQDPAQPACTGRIVIGQSFLSDQLAPVMKQVVDRQLRGLDVFPVGKYQSIQHLGLEWAQLPAHLGDVAMLGSKWPQLPSGQPSGYIRVTARVQFERVDVPVIVALVPQPSPTQMKFAIGARADLEFDNRVLDWMSDKLGADKLASQIARQQIDDVLVTTFAPPPPFDLGGGQTLQFTFCADPIEITNTGYGALPFGVHIEGHAGLLPPQFARRGADGSIAPRATPAPSTQLAIDLDIDALNAMLFELWRTGWLDARLGEVGLDRTFNTDPTVQEYLSIRISPPKLALPPVISPGAKLRLAADARVTIEDGASTVGRLYGALDFSLSSKTLEPSVDLGALELACEQRPNILVPCYGDLVAALRDRGSEFHGALTHAFTALLSDIFVERHLSAEGLPVELVIDSATAGLGGPATLHLELAGKLAPLP